ncbi:MAG: LPS-assembly protein LptD [Betaproteobacteria bacterium]|nr:LPS-assembly protein LptD [Betaproteobacteria bacterium]MDH3435673.1 LPS-assembly protein LptD [Betaproteobacteria bacterium]
MKRVSLAILCALPFATCAETGLKLKMQRTLILAPPAPHESVPVFLEADRLQGHSERETEVEGGVQLRRRRQAVDADWLRYDKPSNEVSARGNVRIQQGTDVVEGDELQFNLETERGFMDKTRYQLRRSPKLTGKPLPAGPTDARGTADRILFEGPKRYRARKGTYTTCGPGHEDWYVRAGDLEIDKGRDVGVARDASIEFQGVPILYSPYLSFPLHRERKSGFLTPHYGSTSKGGLEITVPYYWNIAPNYDATISPRFITKRGVLIGTEFRYLQPSYLGEARLDVLPNDRKFNDEERHAYFLRHNQTLPYGWSGALNLQGVSDNTYFTDLSTEIQFTSQVNLPREATLNRSGTWAGSGTYAFNALVQSWQTLQTDPLRPVVPPYRQLPRLRLNATRSDTLRSDFDFQGEFVAFDTDREFRVTANRTMVYPSLSMPLQTAYGYLTPKVGFNFTNYAVDPNATSFADQSRSLPILSADSGIVLERPTTFQGVSILQTLEPRLYYVYIPYRDQSAIPVFDTGQEDINFTTIYAENQFSSWDRINDANQLTVGVSSRLLSAASGAERLRVGVAQRYYFASQRVTLPGRPARTSSSSDLLAGLSGQVAPNWVAEANLQYSTNFSQTQKFDVGARYQPAPGRVLNLSYRETINTQRQTDISTQWPVGGGWVALGRWNYSLRDRKTLESLLGVEYNADCWSLRVVAHRFAITTEQNSSTFFVQLELNGLSQIGSSPFDTLRRNIGGYFQIDPRVRQSSGSPDPYY